MNFLNMKNFTSKNKNFSSKFDFLLKNKKFICSTFDFLLRNLISAQKEWRII